MSDVPATNGPKALVKELNLPIMRVLPVWLFINFFVFSKCSFLKKKYLPYFERNE